MNTTWPTVQLGTLLTDIQPGFASGKHNSEGEGIPHFRPMNVSTHGHIERSVMKYVDPSAGRPDIRLEAGDILFNNTNSPELVGKTALFEDEDSPAFSNHMTRLRVDSKQLDAEYAALRLHQAWREGWFAAHCNNHVSQASISREVLKGFEIELPPLDVQHAITSLSNAIRDSRLSAATHLVDAQTAVMRFRQSVLTAACSGRLTAGWRIKNQVDTGDELVDRVSKERRAHLGRRYRDELPTETGTMPEIPESWSWASPGSLCEPDRIITYGVIKLGPPVEDGVPTLRSSDVRWLHIDSSRVKRISQEIADNYKRTYLKGGEILVTVRGTLGGVAVAPADMAGWNVSREVAVIPLSRYLDADYCALWIGSMHSQRWLTGVAKGVAYTGVNIEDLRKLPLPIPPIAEQREIVRVVSHLLKSADALLARIDASSHRVDRTSQAVLAKAFRGELIAAEDHPDV